MAITIEEVVYLPENLIIEILSWLPVKDLLRYKSVSKSWYAIISSPDFITKHLENYYNNSDDWHGCLLVQHCTIYGGLQLYELFVDESPRVLASEVLDDKPGYCEYVYGPCDGLYFVQYQRGFCVRGLWNPSINQFEYLPDLVGNPNLPRIFTYASFEVYGFGLDPISGDYKVVVIKDFQHKNEDNRDLKHSTSVLVYSLRTNSWRYCGDLAKAYYLEKNTCYIYVNGCCYWFGSYEFTFEVIISFDFATNVYKEIHVPNYAQPSFRCLAMYDDSLTLLSLQENKIFEIWTWNHEGFWTKKLMVEPFPDVWLPVGYWKDNRLILQREDGRLVLFDPETQEVKDLGFQNAVRCKGVFAYIGSLVSIKEKEVRAT